MSTVERPQDNGLDIQQRIDQRATAAPHAPSGTEPRELQIEELEERIAPKLAANHNEALLVP